MRTREYVLIYPYWNVNLLALGIAAIEVTCFNLSILECKFVEHSEGKAKADRFNLSILECKYYIQYIHCYKPTGFNLSILECKCRKAA